MQDDQIPSNISTLQSAWGWVAGVFGSAVYWLNRRIESKVSKEAFSIHLNANEKAMNATTKLCDANTRSLEKLWDRMEGKEDKKNNNYP